MTLRAIFDTYRRSIAREARLGIRIVTGNAHDSAPTQTF